MNTLLGILGKIVVDGFLVSLLGAIAVALFFIWLNRGDAKVDATALADEVVDGVVLG